VISFLDGSYIVTLVKKRKLIQKGNALMRRENTTVAAQGPCGDVRGVSANNVCFYFCINIPNQTCCSKGKRSPYLNLLEIAMHDFFDYIGENCIRVYSYQQRNRRLST